jgi:hypothetical protein
MDMDTKDDVGQTALHWAVENGHEAEEHRADVDAKTVSGKTASVWPTNRPTQTSPSERSVWHRNMSVCKPTNRLTGFHNWASVSKSGGNFPNLVMTFLIGWSKPEMRVSRAQRVLNFL